MRELINNNINKQFVNVNNAFTVFKILKECVLTNIANKGNITIEYNQLLKILKEKDVADEGMRPNFLSFFLLIGLTNEIIHATDNTAPPLSPIVVSKANNLPTHGEGNGGEVGGFIDEFLYQKHGIHRTTNMGYSKGSYSKYFYIMLIRKS